MWEFLSNVLEQGGVVAAFFMIYSIAVAFGIRFLMNQNQKLHEKMADVQKEEAEKRAKMRDAHDREVEVMRKAFADAVDEQKAKALADAVEYATRIDSLQERRIAESQAVIREVVNHVQHTRAAVERVGDTMDVLKDVVTGRR